MPKSLSIVIPVYNEEDLLGACLQSIAAQTIAPDEVIVVDNNSTDRSVEIARSFPFVKVVAESKQGIVYARNTGFDAVNSDIIGRIDADTILPRDWVARIKDYYANEEHMLRAVTGSGYYYNLHLPRLNGWAQSLPLFDLHRLIIGYGALWGSNMALPRLHWQKVRQMLCMRSDIHEDHDLAFHLHEQGYSTEYLKHIKVGVELKRVLSSRHEQLMHLSRWPSTLRVHRQKQWLLGVVGNWFLYYVVQPLLLIVEYGARLLGRAPLG